MSEIRVEVRRLRQEGLGASEIAHRLDVARSTVHYHLRRMEEAMSSDSVRKGAGGTRRSVPTQALVRSLLGRGLSRAEIARRLGLSKSTVSYHARQLGEAVDARCARRFNWRDVQTYYDEGHSVRECVRAFGFSSWSWYYAVQRGAVRPRPAFRPLEETFAAGTRRNRGHLKTRLLLAGLKEPKCERCGIDEWRGIALSLELHHVNGERNDNRIENLELLCPNCHSQTDNFAGRNREANLRAA